MSNRAITWAYGRRELKSGPRFILVTLGDLADQEHSCFPSIGMLSELTGQSETTVSDNLRKLRDMGLVSLERRHKKSGARTTNRYYLPVDNYDVKPDSGVRPKAGFRPTQKPDSGGALRNNPQTLTPNGDSVPETQSPGAVDKSDRDQDEKSPHGHHLSAVPSPAMVPHLLADIDVDLIRKRCWRTLDPTGISDDEIRELAHRIIGCAPTLVIAPTAYVIKAIRNDEHEWQAIALDIAAGELAATAERGGNDF